MHRSASCLIVFLAVGLLAAAPPNVPPSQPPNVPKAVSPFLDDALPPPRAVPRPPTTGSIVEEPAPAPHQLPSAPVRVMPQGQFHEEPAPMPHEQTPPPPRLMMPGVSRGSAMPEVDVLRREIQNLRMEREAMLAEETDLVTARDLRTGNQNDSARLRQRITELLARAAQNARKESVPVAPPRSNKPETHRSPGQHSSGSTSPPSSPTLSSPPVQPAHPSAPVTTSKQPDNTAKVVTDAPIDPPALAQSLFQAGDYTAALNAYRKLEQQEQKPEDRVAIQYMMACCLRKLGKIDEATILYREVANSIGSEILVENAQWYLRSLKDRRELSAQLEEMRQRRQAVMPRRP